MPGHGPISNPDNAGRLPLPLLLVRSIADPTPPPLHHSSTLCADLAALEYILPASDNVGYSEVDGDSDEGAYAVAGPVDGGAATSDIPGCAESPGDAVTSDLSEHAASPSEAAYTSGLYDTIADAGDPPADNAGNVAVVPPIVKEAGKAASSPDIKPGTRDEADYAWPQMLRDGGIALSLIIGIAALAMAGGGSSDGNSGGGGGGGAATAVALTAGRIPQVARMPASFSGQVDVLTSADHVLAEEGVFDSMVNATGAVRFRNVAVYSTLDWLPNLTHVSGSIEFKDNKEIVALGDHCLANLTSAGSLDFSGNDALTSTANALANLVTVTGSLYFRQNVALGSLGRLFENLVSTDGGTLYFENNDAIEQLDGAFPALFNASGIEIEHNLALRSLGSAFSVLNRTRSSLYIRNNPNLTNIAEAFPRLSSASTVYVSNNNQLRSLGPAFPQLGRTSSSIYIQQNGNLTSVDEAFPRLATAGAVYIQHNDALRSLGGAFGELLSTDSGSIGITNNGNLDTLGSSFASTAYIRGSLNIQNNANLSTLGSSFAGLRSVRGGISISGNSKLNNFETLRGLRCHGGVQSSSGNQAPLPDWLLNLPRCDPEVAPTPPPPTVPGATRTTVTYTTATLTTTTLAGTRVVGNVIVSQLHSPAAVCTGGTYSSPTDCTVLTAEEEAAISEITGTVSISHTQDGTLDGRFAQLKVIGGGLRITQNGALRSFGDAFASLQIVRGALYIQSCSAVRSFATAFASLHTVGGQFYMQSVGENSDSGEVAGANLFPSLETVGGTFYMSSVHFASFVDAFRSLRTVGGDLSMQYLYRLASISGASFRQLRTVGGDFYMQSLNRLQIIEGPAFSSLRAVRYGLRSSSSRFSGSAFRMVSMGQLRTIAGSAFGSLEAVYGDMQTTNLEQLADLGSFLALTEVAGQLSMYGLSPTFNRETALPALNCVGSVNYQTSSRIQVPLHVVNLPACTATYSPTPPGYTRTTATRTTATRTTTTLPGTKAIGNVIVSQLHSPAAVCTGGTYSSPTDCTVLTAEEEAAISEITGTVSISHTQDGTLDGRFAQLKVIGGGLRITQNGALRSFGDAFASLQIVRGALYIQSCSAVRSFATAFASLHTVGGQFYMQSVGENSDSGEVAGANLFPSLETVGGTFYMSSVHFASFVDAFRSLRTVGGDLSMQYLYRLASISGASFRQLRTVGGDFYMQSLNRLQIIEGPAFSSLRAVRYGLRSSSSRFSGSAFRMVSMGQLRTIAGSAFGSLEAVYGDMQTTNLEQLADLGSFLALTEVAGQLSMYGLSPTFNRETALPALNCVGSVNYQTSSRIQVPLHVVNLPACTATYSPTPPGYTRTTATRTTATRTTTTLPGTKAIGNIIVSQVHSPAALCTGGTYSSPTDCTELDAEAEAALTEVTGSISVSYSDLTTLDGRFANVISVGGHVYVQQNSALSSLGDAFASLRSVGESVTIQGCLALRSFNTSFASLRTVRSQLYITSVGQSSDGGEVAGANLFPSLETVGGQFYMTSAHFASFVDAFRSLRTVGGEIFMQSLGRLEAISGASFQQLTTVGGRFYMQHIERLQIIEGPAFSSLRAVRHSLRSSSSRFSGSAFNMAYMSRLRVITGSAFGALEAVYGDMQIYTMSRLGGLGSFLALTEVTGQLSMYGLSPAFNRDAALPALDCVGSINYRTSASVQVPARVSALPACPSTHAPTPPGYTRTTQTRTTTTKTASTTTSTTLPGYNVVGNIIVSQLHAPSAVCTGGTYSAPSNCTALSLEEEAQITEVNGTVSVSHTRLTTLTGRFSALKVIGGSLRVGSNSVLRELGDGFAALQVIGGDFVMGNIGASNQPSSGLGLFPSLRTVGGTFYMSWNYFSSLTNSFRSLRTVGGHFRIYYDRGITAINGTSFQALTTVGLSFRLTSASQLRTIDGPAFSSLRYVYNNSRTSSSRTSREAFTIASGGQLRGFTGTAFSALEAVFGNVQVTSCRRLVSMATFTSLINIT